MITDQTNQVGQTNQMGQMIQMGPTGQMGQMGQMGPTGQMGQVGQMGPTGQMGQMGQGNQMGVYGPHGQMMGPAAAGNGYGQMGQSQQQQNAEEDQGVVAEVNVIAGALTTAVVDNLDFDDLDDLAGRGVAVCSELSYDWDWTPTCEEPYYSCCSLAYDNQNSSL